MGRLVIECLQKKIKLKKIAKAVCQTLGQKEKIKVELVFNTSDEIRTLNRNTRGVDSVTDVLSYPTLNDIRGVILKKEDCSTCLDGRYIFLGSIVLCEDKIREQAVEYGNTEERERTYLIIHGLLHLFGYDHMNDVDKAEMRALEKACLLKLGVED